MKKDLIYQHLYLHAPFCAAKCAYCAFYSVPSPEESLIERYLDKLELDCAKKAQKNIQLKSVYIGGGTPNYFSGKNLERLWRILSANFAVGVETEISIECNPNSLTLEKAEIIAKFANRVSIGAQSFNREFRELLGRAGSPERVALAVDSFRKVGIDNIGLDLIYGIPGQSVADWLEDLRAAVDLGIEHLSTYALTLSEGAELSERINKKFIDEDLCAEMWLEAGRWLETQGLNRYEISNFARSGFECIHNSGIWYGECYLGLGPAACSFDGQRRWTEISDMNLWLAAATPELDLLAPEPRAREILVMGLRTSRGWERNLFKERTGFDYMDWLPSLNPLSERDWLIYDDNNIQLTENGLLFWDSVAEELI